MSTKDACSQCGAVVWRVKGSKPLIVCHTCRRAPAHRAAQKAKVNERSRLYQERLRRAAGVPMLEDHSARITAESLVRRARICQWCESPYVTNQRGAKGKNQKYCSNACRGNAYRKAPTKTPVIWTHCGHCNAEFPEPSKGNGPRYCNKQCKHKAQYIRHKDQVNMHSHIRRARIANATVERVVPTDVYERDGYVCQLCGEPCVTGGVPAYDTESGRLLRDPLMPSLDHVKPISLGGEHSMANTQCAHLVCNMMKNNRT
jgi:5-methylcytosine-specific restriction endonuclease McrA